VPAPGVTVSCHNTAESAKKHEPCLDQAANIQLHGLWRQLPLQHGRRQRRRPNGQWLLRQRLRLLLLLRQLLAARQVGGLQRGRPRPRVGGCMQKLTNQQARESPWHCCMVCTSHLRKRARMRNGQKPQGRRAPGSAMTASGWRHLHWRAEYARNPPAPGMRYRTICSSQGTLDWTDPCTSAVTSAKGRAKRRCGGRQELTLQSTGCGRYGKEDTISQEG